MQPPRAPVSETQSPNGMLTDAERAERLEDAMNWSILGVWRRKSLIVGLTATAALAAVVISLLLPNWYQSSARLLMPETTSGGMAALIGNLSPQMARMLGTGGSGDYSRYLALLTSDSMMDAVIERFDLMSVYDTHDGRRPWYDTRRELRKNTDFSVDLRYDYLTISVMDRDPERAAAVANFFVDELNRRNAELSSQNAASFREYVERRYLETVAALDSAQTVMQGLQEEIGVVELPATAEAFMRGIAEQRGRVVQLEIQYGALLNQYGPDNPRTQSAREALAVARRAEAAALQGRDPLLPIGMADLPAAANRYATAYRDVLMQSEMLKVAKPLYEQARFDEEREKVAVQVVDRAQPSEAKVRPHRALIVVTTTTSVFVLAVLAALALAWVQRPDSYIGRLGRYARLQG